MTWRPNQTARLRITPTTAAVTAESAMVMRLLPRNCSMRSEEHTSELQSQSNLVCRLLLEKKKKEAAMHSSRSHRESRILKPRLPRAGSLTCVATRSRLWLALMLDRHVFTTSSYRDMTSRD